MKPAKPDLLEHSGALMVHLSRLLTMAQGRTPGRWTRDPVTIGDVITEADLQTITQTQERVEVAKAGKVAQVRQRNANADYIAACAGNAERAWRSTLHMVWQLRTCDCTGKVNPAPCPNCTRKLKTILRDWPMEELSLSAKDHAQFMYRADHEFKVGDKVSVDWTVHPAYHQMENPKSMVSGRIAMILRRGEVHTRGMQRWYEGGTGYQPKVEGVTTPVDKLFIIGPGGRKLIIPMTVSNSRCVTRKETPTPSQ